MFHESVRFQPAQHLFVNFVERTELPEYDSEVQYCVIFFQKDQGCLSTPVSFVLNLDDHIFVCHGGGAVRWFRYSIQTSQVIFISVRNVKGNFQSKLVEKIFKLSFIQFNLQFQPC